MVKGPFINYREGWRWGGGVTKREGWGASEVYPYKKKGGGVRKVLR